MAYRDDGIGPSLYDWQADEDDRQDMALDAAITQAEGDLCDDLRFKQYERIDALMIEVMERMPVEFYRQLLMLWSGGSDCIFSLRHLLDEAVRAQLIAEAKP